LGKEELKCPKELTLKYNQKDNRYFLYYDEDFLYSTEDQEEAFTSFSNTVSMICEDE